MDNHDLDTIRPEGSRSTLLLTMYMGSILKREGLMSIIIKSKPRLTYCHVVDVPLKFERWPRFARPAGQTDVVPIIVLVLHAVDLIVLVGQDYIREASSQKVLVFSKAIFTVNLHQLFTFHRGKGWSCKKKNFSVRIF